jgi:hypothetical protein
MYVYTGITGSNKILQMILKLVVIFFRGHEQLLSYKHESDWMGRIDGDLHHEYRHHIVPL